MIQNYRVLQDVFNKLKISKDADGNKMVNEYVRDCGIGRGSYGKVVLYRSNNDGLQYAIKHLEGFVIAPLPKMSTNQALRISTLHQVIVEHLSMEEVADMKEMFQKIDINSNGKITLEELKFGLHKMGHQIPDADVQILMEAADVDGDGTLDYGEFVAVSIHIRKIGNDEHLHKAFAYFDKDKSGYIEIEELRDSLADDLGPSHEEVINAIIRDVDSDKDGKISYDEFAAMMKAGTDWRKASRQYSRERFNRISSRLMKDGSLQLQK